MSTNKEFALKKSAPKRSLLTFARTKVHRNHPTGNSIVTVRLPYVLIELPLAATRAGPGLLKKRSWLDGGKTLTSAPVSTKKERLDIQS